MPTHPVWLRVVGFFVLTVASAYILQFAILAGIRAFYPFELEWIEGAYVDEMRRIVQGRPVYSAPTISFMPVNKTPLYFYLSAWLMRAGGLGFTAPRLLSALSALGAFFLLFAIVLENDRQAVLPGVVAAGLYAGSFRFAGAWMDIAKPDSLFLFLVLAGFFVSLRYPARWRWLVSGLLYVAAYFTKQLALPVILVMAPISLGASRGRTWPQWACVAVVGPLVFLGLDVVTNGWFSFYTFDSLAYHAVELDLWSFWQKLLASTWPAILVGLVYPVSVLVRRGLHEGMRSERLWHNLGLGAALIVTSWSVYRKTWTYDNGLMPACAGLALLAGLGSGEALDWVRRGVRRSTRFLLIGGVLALLLCQFGMLLYNPVEQLADVEHRRTWAAFLNRVKELPGEMLVFKHGFVNYLAGKNPCIHVAPYGSVAGWAYEPRIADHRRRGNMVGEMLPQALERQMFEWIFAGSSKGDAWLPYYVPASGDPVVLPMLTGAPSVPESFFVKNPVASGGHYPLRDRSFGHLFGEGWSEPEGWGRWAVGHRASLRVALEPGVEYELALGVFPFCPTEFAGQRLSVGWNDRLLGRYAFTSCDGSQVRFNLPSEAVSGDLDRLWFEFGQATSPAELGLSGDQRALSVGFRSIVLIQQGS